MNVVHYTACPVCNSSHIGPLLTLKDHSVSKEEFVVWQCADCTLRFTQDAPDEDSVAPYYQSEDYISHTNTAKGFINQLYQKARKFTLRQKRNLIRQTTGLQQGAILDVGAGTGAFLRTMKDSGWQVTGLEPDEAARSIAKKSFGVDLLPVDELKTLTTASFDAITLWHVLEHVHHLHDYIDTLKSLLKTKGRLFIAVPNYTSADAYIYSTAWAAYDVPRHLYHFTPKSMQQLMQHHGLKITAKKRMWLDAFYISLLSSKYRHQKANLVGAVISGIRSDVTALFQKDRCSSLIYILEKA